MCQQLPLYIRKSLQLYTTFLGDVDLFYIKQTWLKQGGAGEILIAPNLKIIQKKKYRKFTTKLSKVIRFKINGHMSFNKILNIVLKKIFILNMFLSNQHSINDLESYKKTCEKSCNRFDDDG